LSSEQPTWVSLMQCLSGLHRHMGAHRHIACLQSIGQEMFCCFSGNQKSKSFYGNENFIDHCSASGSTKLKKPQQDEKSGSGAGEDTPRPQRSSWLQIDDKGELNIQEVLSLSMPSLLPRARHTHLLPITSEFTVWHQRL